MRRLLVYRHGPILFRHTPNHSWHDAGRGAKTDEPAKPTAGSTLPHTTLPHTEFLPRACPQPGNSDTIIVNKRYICKVNIPKQRLVITDYDRFTFQLPISRDALKQLKALITLSTEKK